MDLNKEAVAQQAAIGILVQDLEIENQRVVHVSFFAPSGGPFRVVS